MSADSAWESSGSDDRKEVFYGERVASAGDINGDGYDDVIVGAYDYDNGTNNSAGAAYIVYGYDVNTTTDFAGTIGGDNFSGSGSAEVFIGGLGNDTLTGGGGADSIRAGAGDDTIIVPDLAALNFLARSSPPFESNS